MRLSKPKMAEDATIMPVAPAVVPVATACGANLSAAVTSAAAAFRTPDPEAASFISVIVMVVRSALCRVVKTLSEIPKSSVTLNAPDEKTAESEGSFLATTAATIVAALRISMDSALDVAVTASAAIEAKFAELVRPSSAVLFSKRHLGRSIVTLVLNVRSEPGPMDLMHAYVSGYVFFVAVFKVASVL